MTIHLLNSAVMPQPGFYELVEIDSDTFAQEVKDAPSQSRHQTLHRIQKHFDRRRTNDGYRPGAAEL